MNNIISSTRYTYIAPVISTERLHFHKDTKTLAGEASELGNFQGQLYSDACDIGVLVSNPRTGNAVPFVLAREVRDSEGDIQGWDFEVAGEAVRKDSKLAGLKLVVFND